MGAEDVVWTEEGEPPEMLAPLEQKSAGRNMGKGGGQQELHQCKDMEMLQWSVLLLDLQYYFTYPLSKIHLKRIWSHIKIGQNRTHIFKAKH